MRRGLLFDSCVICVFEFAVTSFVVISYLLSDAGSRTPDPECDVGQPRLSWDGPARWDVPRKPGPTQFFPGCRNAIANGLSYSRIIAESVNPRSCLFTRRGLLAAALALRLRFPRPTIQTQLNTLRRFGLPAPPGGALGPRRLGAVYIHQSRCPLPTASASRRVAVAAARWAALFDSPPRLLRPHRALRLAAFTCDT